MKTFKVLFKICTFLLYIVSNNQMLRLVSSTSVQNDTFSNKEFLTSPILEMSGTGPQYITFSKSHISIKQSKIITSLTHMYTDFYILIIKKSMHPLIHTIYKRLMIDWWSAEKEKAYTIQCGMLLDQYHTAATFIMLINHSSISSEMF